jgi:hypothetical protein
MTLTLLRILNIINSAKPAEPIALEPNRKNLLPVGNSFCTVRFF